jgi:hypothetical protein
MVIISHDLVEAGVSPFPFIATADIAVQAGDCQFCTEDGGLCGKCQPACDHLGPVVFGEGDFVDAIADAELAVLKGCEEAEDVVEPIMDASMFDLTDEPFCVVGVL